MFRSAATKLAHNSTIPALAGNGDLRSLQELITAEKAVVNSLQRLSADTVKASECLRHWGSGEGDDLHDTLSASATLIAHFANALQQFASHEMAIRDYMKGIRSREEKLDELRRRRRAVAAKADSAERKLSKMSPEHKSLQQQTELLNGLREQIRGMDWEILTEEARLGDFKRVTTKNWMMLKFGGLLECAEKATIVGELGKMVIEEIPLDTTQPGQNRAFYAGHDKTDKYVAEAQRCITEIVFDPQPVASLGEPISPPKPSFSTQQLTSPETSSLRYPEQPFAGASPRIDGLPSTDSGFGSRSNRDSGVYGGQGMPGPSQDFGGPSGGPGSGFSATYTPGFERDSSKVDEFGNVIDFDGRRGYGTMPMSSGPIRMGDDDSRLGLNDNSAPSSPVPSRFGVNTTNMNNSTGGRFAMFPVRKSSLAEHAPAASQSLSQVPPPPSLASPLPPQQHASGPAPGLSFRPLDSGPSDSLSFSAEIADALAHGGSNFTTIAKEKPTASGALGSDASARNSSEGPAPTYESHYNTPVFNITPSGLPKGAAPPAAANPWGEPSPLPGPGGESAGVGSDLVHGPGSAPSPYPPLSQPYAPQHHGQNQEVDAPDDVSEDEEDTELPYASPPPRDAPQLPQLSSERSDRHVHFGSGGSDVAQQSHTGEGSAHERYASEDDGHGQAIPPFTPTQLNDNGPVSPFNRPSERIPSPPPAMDENALNAAAAREVAREMDSLSFSPPALSINRTPSPLMPPAPPFAQQQAVTPNITNVNASYAPKSDSMFRGSRTDLRGSLPEPSAQAQTLSSSPPSALQQPRPQLNVQTPSPSLSFSSTAYGTPPEYPTPPLRNPSPASPSVINPGTRTISAAAFKRPQMRSPSGESLPSRPLPDINPLSFNKKKGGLPGSPYPQRLGPEGELGQRSRDVSPAPPPGAAQPNQAPGYLDHYSIAQEQRPRNSMDSGQQAQDHYDFIASYGEPGSPTHQERPQNGEGTGSPGYGQGKFATNLENEGLR